MISFEELIEMTDKLTEYARMDDCELDYDLINTSTEQALDGLSADQLTSLIVTFFGVLRHKDYRRFMATIGGIHRTMMSEVSSMLR